VVQRFSARTLPEKTRRKLDKTWDKGQPPISVTENSCLSLIFTGIKGPFTATIDYGMPFEVKAAAITVQPTGPATKPTGG
jgi:hypothetical protein